MIDNRPGMSVEVDGSEAEERDHVRREIIDALDRRAVNGATRELTHTGLTLTESEWAEIGSDSLVGWIRGRLGCTVGTMDDGSVEIGVAS